LFAKDGENNSRRVNEDIGSQVRIDEETRGKCYIPVKPSK